MWIGITNDHIIKSMWSTIYNMVYNYTISTIYRMTPTLHNFWFGQPIMWIGTTNDHIIKSICSTMYYNISCSKSHNKLTKTKII